MKNQTNSIPLLVRIHDQDTGEFDQFAIAPAGMGCDTAAAIVDRLVRKVKEDDEYQFEDLERELTAEGFVCPRVQDASERW